MILSFIKLLLYLAFYVYALPIGATQPYQPIMENPILDVQNWRVFPELKGKGVRCLTEAPDHTIWFGVDKGLLHYDGIDWTPYTQEQGLYGESVDVLLTSQSGHIYAGSNIGISRYDGEKWTRFFPPHDDIYWTIHDIIETKNGTLWAATTWGALRISATDTTLYSTSHIAKALQPYLPYLKIQVIPQHAVAKQPWEPGVGAQITSGSHQYAVAEKSRGLIWAIAPNSPAEQAGLHVGDQIKTLQGRRGITQLLLNGPSGSDVTLETTHIGTDSTHHLKLTRQNVSGTFEDFRLLDVFEDRQQNIWFGLLEGDIVRYTPHQNQWTKFTTEEGLSLGALPRIFQTKDGTIWTLSDHPHGGINQFDGKKWSHFFLSKMGGPDVNTSLLETKDGTIWLGSLGLLWIYQNDQWQALEIPEARQVPTQRARLYETTDGSVWVVGLGQHAALHDHQHIRKLKWTNLKYQCENTNGNKWFLSIEGYAVVQSGNTWTAYTQQDGLIDAPTRLYMTSWGELWAAGSHDSTSATAQFDGQEWHKKIHPNHSWGIDSRTVYEAPDKTLWFGAEVNKIDHRGDQGGLLHYDPTKQQTSQSPWTHLAPPHAPEGAYGIVQTADGTLWVCGWYGLRAFDGKLWSLPTEEHLQNSPCDALYVDHDDNLWVGTRRYGLFRFDGQNWTQYTTEDGLADNNLNRITQIQSGAILVATSRGMNNFDGYSWSRFAISHLDINAIYQSNDGAIWVNYHSPTWSKRAKPDPKPIGPYYLSTIRYQPDPIPPQTKITFRTPNISSKGNVTFSWQGTDAWHATPSSDMQYAIRIDQDPWSTFTTKKTINYTALPSGSHIFEVKARDLDLNTDITPAAIHFHVAYPIWQQPWFLTLFTLLLSGIAIQTFRVFKRGQILAQTNESLETRVAERTKQLSESRNQLQLALNTANLGIWTLDIATHKIVSSGKTGLIVGVPKEQPDIKFEELLKRVHPDDQHRVQHAFSTLMDGSQPTQHLECCILVNDEPKWIEVQAQTLPSITGEPDHILGTIQDITLHRKSAQEMVKLDRLRALGEMAAGVSHNLNNILMGILGPAQILHHKGLSEEQKVEVDTIYRSGIRARDLVKRLYQGLGDIQETFEGVSIPEIIQEAIQSTRPRWKDESESRGITIQVTTDIAPDLPSIRGTKTGLNDIIVNLILNAVDAMPQGGCVRISAQKQQHQVCLAISDTGQGMDEKTRDRIFEPFFTTKMDVGTGLGLATVYGTLTRWQGDIQVSSEPNKGTTFNLFFQLWSKQQTSELVPQKQHKIPRARILILDDDETVRNTVSEFLCIHHDVTTFERPQEALANFKPKEYDIAIIDLGLPQTPGDAICQILKEKDPHIKTMLMTGWHINPTDPRRTYADHYLQKPFTDLKQLNNTIVDCLKPVQ